MILRWSCTIETRSLKTDNSDWRIIGIAWDLDWFISDWNWLNHDRLARSIDLLIQWQLKSKSLDWPRFRIVRVPPLGTSGGTSRPMRSQYSELSTNQEPRFGQDFWLWPKLESTNPMQMCQSAASLYREFIPVLNQPIWYQLRTNLKTIETQYDAN